MWIRLDRGNGPTICNLLRRMAFSMERSLWQSTTIVMVYLKRMTYSFFGLLTTSTRENHTVSDVEAPIIRRHMGIGQPRSISDSSG
jgi:hypothetical protein